MLYMLLIWPRRRSSHLGFPGIPLVEAQQVLSNVIKDGLYKALWPIDTLPELVIAYHGNGYHQIRRRPLPPVYRSLNGTGDTGITT